MVIDNIPYRGYFDVIPCRGYMGLYGDQDMKITSSKMLANELRNHRIEQHKTQIDISELVGIKQTTISSFENKPDGTKLETLFKILNALNLELSINERGKPNDQWNNEGW